MPERDGGRRSAVGWVRDVLRAGYHEGNLSRMLARAPRFVLRDLLGERLRWHLLTRPLRGRVLDRDALLERTNARDAIWDAGSAEPFTIDPPEGSEGLPPSLASMVGTYRPERPFVCEVRDARLLGRDAFALADGEVVLETASASEMYLYFELSDLYDALAADRSHREAYRIYRAVLDGRQSLPIAPERLTRRPATPRRPMVGGDGVDGETVDGAGSGASDGAGDGVTAEADEGATDEVRDGDSTRAPLGTAATFIPYWRNYYHWTMEFLPKIRPLERYAAATGREPTVLVEPDPPTWLLETLRLAGWDGEVREWHAGERRIDRLVVPIHRNRFFAPQDSRFGDDFNPAPDDVRWLARRMQSNVPDVDDGRFPDRIVLSRRDTKYRPVVNEDAVMAALEPMGFELFALGELPLEDQIRLFAGADTVVSPHGAGLVNLIHATDATVVELFPEGKVEAYYFCLARQLGFDYEWAVYPTRGDAMVVDADHLRTLVAHTVGE